VLGESGKERNTVKKMRLESRKTITRGGFNVGDLGSGLEMEFLFLT
jgi:hypothetical protein